MPFEARKSKFMVSSCDGNKSQLGLEIAIKTFNVELALTLIFEARVLVVT